MKSRITITRVYWVYQGSPLTADITDASPATGGNLQVDFHTDFAPASDGEVRTILIDDEEITYTDVDEATDTLLNITRAANGTVAAAHDEGVFVYAGATPKREKFADGFIDDDEALSKGVEIHRHLWSFYSVGDRDNDEMEVATVRYADDGHPVIVDAPSDREVELSATPLVIPVWSSGEEAAVSVQPHRFAVPVSGVIQRVYATVGTDEAGTPTPPDGDDLIIDLLHEGTAVATMTVLDGEEHSERELLDPPLAVTLWENLQVEFTQVGSSFPGANITVWAVMWASVDSTPPRVEVLGPQGDPGADGVGVPPGGTTGQRLSKASDDDYDTEWQTATAGAFVGCRVYRATTAQVITNAAWTAVQWNAEDEDSGSIHDNATNNDRLTPPAGRYFVSTVAQFAQSATGVRFVRIVKNLSGGGTEVQAVGIRPTNSSSSSSSVETFTTVRLAAGDYITIEVHQTSGANRDLNAGKENTTAELHLVGS